MEALAQSGAAGDIALESGRYILTQGVLGAMLVVVSVVAGYVIYRLWSELRTVEARSHERHEKLIEMAQSVIASNEQNVRSREEQTRAMQSVSASLASQTDAFKHMGELQASQISRVMDALGRKT